MVALVEPQPTNLFVFYVSKDESVELLFEILANMKREFSAKPYIGGWRVEFNCTHKEREQFTDLGFFATQRNSLEG